MKHSYLLASSLLLFSACGKDDAPELSLPGEYRAENRIVATAINMYTSNGQVNNNTLIDKFIRRHQVGSYFSRIDVPVPAGNSLTLSISSDNKATFVSMAPNDPRSPDILKAEILSRLQDHFVLAEFDSVNLASSVSSDRCEQLSRNMMLELPNKRCRALPPVTGFSQQCRYRPTSVLLVKDGNLRLPFFSWLIKNQQGLGYCSNAYNGVRNIFNTTVLNQLRTGDTIVVQVREVPFIKQ